jgi:hypothetical protein
MLRLTEVASQSETFVKRTLRKSKSKNVNRNEFFNCPPRAIRSKFFLLTGRLYWLLDGAFRKDYD